ASPASNFSHWRDPIHRAFQTRPPPPGRRRRFFERKAAAYATLAAAHNMTPEHATDRRGRSADSHEPTQSLNKRSTPYPVVSVDCGRYLKGGSRQRARQERLGAVDIPSRLLWPNVAR